MIAPARQSVRNASIEALRIVSMIMIITLHFLGHGGVLENLDIFSGNYFLYWTIEGISYVAVNCYVLISGYFLINSSFKLKKLIMLIAEVFFYSVIIYAIMVAFGLVGFSFDGFVKALFPTMSYGYWFFTMYIGLYILFPFLNSFIKSISKKQLLVCILCLILLFSIWTTVFFYSLGLNFGGGTGIVWFSVLYIIGAYIRLYYDPTHKTKKLFLAYNHIALLVPISRFVIALLSKTALSTLVPVDILLKGSSVFYKYNSILVLSASVLLFILFLNLDIKNKVLSKCICFVAPLTFGVYLIHDNNYIRDILWNFVDAPTKIDKPYFFFWAIGIIIALFVLCSGVNYLRLLLFKKFFSLNWVNKLIAAIENKSKLLFNKLIKSIL